MLLRLEVPSLMQCKSKSDTLSLIMPPCREVVSLITSYMFQDDVSLLNMATGSRSWWVRNGYGCHIDAVFTDNTTVQTSSPSTETSAAPASFMGTTIVGCIISYEYVEVLQAGVQCALVVSKVIGV